MGPQELGKEKAILGKTVPGISSVVLRTTQNMEEADELCRDYKAWPTSPGWGP